jgi:hypothetical protein
MTDSARTEEIRARVEKASCGPWKVLRGKDDGHDWMLAQFGAGLDDEAVRLHTDGVRGEGLSDADADAEFCAHARSDVPYLLTELTALREEVERVRNEALELAAQEAEKDAVEYGEDTGSPQDEAYNAALTHAAERIRRLKSPAGPVQPAQEQEHSSA